MPREQAEPTDSPPDSGSDFDEYYRSDVKPLERFVMRLGGTLQEAQDTVHDAMVEVFKKWDTVKMGYPKAYARTVAERRYLRSRARAQQEIEKLQNANWTLPDTGNDIENVVIKDEGRRLIALLQRLPYEQRRVCALHLDDFSNREIAAIVGKPEATVRSNLRHGLSKIKQLWSERHPDATSTGRRADDERQGH